MTEVLDSTGSIVRFVSETFRETSTPVSTVRGLTSSTTSIFSSSGEDGEVVSAVSVILSFCEGDEETAVVGSSSILLYKQHPLPKLRTGRMKIGLNSKIPRASNVGIHIFL